MTVRKLSVKAALAKNKAPAKKKKAPAKKKAPTTTKAPAKKKKAPTTTKAPATTTKAPARTPTTGKPSSVRAAGWLDDTTLAVLVERNKQRVVLLVENGAVIGERAAATKAFRVAALPSGAIVTLTSDGKGKITTATGVRAANVGTRIDDLVVVGGVAYAVPTSRALYRLDESTGSWTELGLGAAVAAQCPKSDGSTTKTFAVTAGARGPIAAVYAGGYNSVIVMEHTGTDWQLRGRPISTRANAIAYSPVDDVVYLCGDQIATIDKQGKVTILSTLSDDDEADLWAAGWTTRGLLGSTLRSVAQFDTTGRNASLLLAPGDGEVPRNHSLFVSPSGRSAAFVRGGQLFVLARGGFEHVPL